MAHKQYKGKNMDAVSLYLDIDLYEKVKEHVRLTEIGSISKLMNNTLTEYYETHKKEMK